MKTEFRPRGVCSRKMTIDTENGIIRSLKVEGGCSGNLQGISRLVEGMSVAEAAKRLRGIRCGMKSTSCPDQLAVALERIMEETEEW